MISERRQPALPLVLAILVLLGFGGRAQAQTQAPALPAVLTSVSATSQGHGDAAQGETQVTLTFSPHAPGFSIINDGTQTPAIAFALSSRGGGAVAPPAPSGLLRSISFDQEDTVLVLHLSVESRAKITATPVGASTISLTISPTQDASSSLAAANTSKMIDAPAGQDGYEIVLLKYADISEVAGLLSAGASVKPNDSFTPQEPAFGAAGLNGATYASAPIPADQPSNDSLGQTVDDSISVDRRLNAIILRGSPEQIARLKRRIAQLDVPVQSVLLETVFVELDETAAKNVGLDFNNTSSQLAVATYQTGADIPSSGFGATSSTAHGVASLSLQAAIAAQVQAGHGRIVSTPRIASQSGSTAKINTGDALPILTSIALAGVTGVTQQVQYVNVGVTLQIAPRITSDGFVTSHIFCVVSSVTGFSQGYPTISQREAETSATVKDGETMVIGGLTQESDLSSGSDLAGPGQAPILRNLFGSHTRTHSKTELYVVVTPHIVGRGDAAATVAGLPPKVQ